MQRVEIEPGRVRHEGEHCSVEIWAPTTTRAPVLVVRVEGHAREELVRPLLTALEDAMRRGDLIVFDDWEAVTGYESDVRVQMTDWTRKHGYRIAETHILMASKILSMGVSLATRAAGLPVTTYTSRFDFERAVKARFPQYRSMERRSA